MSIRIETKAPMKAKEAQVDEATIKLSLLDNTSKQVAITQCDELPLVLTPMDIAKVLNISKNTAYEMVHSKDFPCFKVGKQYRIRRERFFQWMDEVAA